MTPWKREKAIHNERSKIVFHSVHSHLFLDSLFWFRIRTVQDHRYSLWWGKRQVGLGEPEKKPLKMWRTLWFFKHWTQLKGSVANISVILSMCLKNCRALIILFLLCSLWVHTYPETLLNSVISWIEITNKRMIYTWQCVIYEYKKKYCICVWWATDPIFHKRRSHIFENFYVLMFCSRKYAFMCINGTRMSNKEISYMHFLIFQDVCSFSK